MFTLNFDLSQLLRSIVRGGGRTVGIISTYACGRSEGAETRKLCSQPSPGSVHAVCGLTEEMQQKTPPQDWHVVQKKKQQKQKPLVNWADSVLYFPVPGPTPGPLPSPLTPLIREEPECVQGKDVQSCRPGQTTSAPRSDPLTRVLQSSHATDRLFNGSASRRQGIFPPKGHQTSASSTYPMPNIHGTTGIITRCPGSTTPLAPQVSTFQEAPTPDMFQPQLCPAPTPSLPRSLLPNRMVTPHERVESGRAERGELDGVWRLPNGATHSRNIYDDLDSDIEDLPDYSDFASSAISPSA